MATSKPLNWQVSDIIQWFKSKELVINEDFQRYSVWTPQAKTFLIDTILNELPLPKIYIRTILDPKKQTSIREVVDGQQRIRSIVEFANGDFALSKRSENFFGQKYDDLDEDYKEKFLGYTITVEQLLNASDDDVIDIFARLNSYTVSLNNAEKRHAEFQTEFKFAVRKTSQDHRWFIEKYRVFTTRQRFRMADDQFFAEIFSLLIEGVTDGGASRLRKLYTSQDDDKFTDVLHQKHRSKIDSGLKFMDEVIGDAIKNEFSKHYHLLMILAAFFHHKYKIPDGQIDQMPQRGTLADGATIVERLAKLERSFEQDPVPPKYRKFIEASSASTQRIASRKDRFLLLCELLSA